MSSRLHGALAGVWSRRLARQRGSAAVLATPRGPPRPSLHLLLSPRPLLQSFQTVTEDLKRRFAVNGEPLIDEHLVGSLSRGASPHWSNDAYKRQTGFQLPPGALQLSSSGAARCRAAGLGRFARLPAWKCFPRPCRRGSERAALGGVVALRQAR